MTPEQEIIRERIRRLSEVTGKSYSALARDAGLVPSTLTRFMNKDVTHNLSTTTLAKLNALSLTTVSTQLKEDPDLLGHLGRRMLLVRRIIGRNTKDADIAALFGWSLPQMDAIFRGDEAPTLGALKAFAYRFNVTVDFLLSESLEGMPRASERMLTVADPTIGMPRDDTEPGTGTGQV